MSVELEAVGAMAGGPKEQAREQRGAKPLLLLAFTCS